MNIMRLKIRLLLFPAALLLIAAAPGKQPHLDRDKLPYGCATCHSGGGFQSGGGSRGCLACHSSSPPGKGFLGSGVRIPDIATEMLKESKHPVLKPESQGVHRKGEALPEVDRKVKRHAECADCHDPHLLSPDNKFAGKKTRKYGNFVGDVQKEHELCYLCHGDSVNLPPRSTNKRLEFALSNPSYHPVEGEGKTEEVPSLLKPYKGKKTQPGDVSTMSCSDCHGSENPSSPRGPHGSANPFILKENYSIKDKVVETAETYALCYRCHSRTSILGNESFPYHSLHIKGKAGAFPEGTSCYTCHSSHGSQEYRSLIHFNTQVVMPSSKTSQLRFDKPHTSNTGKCFLSCHDVNHEGVEYTTSETPLLRTRQKTGW